jgi:hypothetical protein
VIASVQCADCSCRLYRVGAGGKLPPFCWNCGAPRAAVEGEPAGEASIGIAIRRLCTRLAPHVAIDLLVQVAAEIHDGREEREAAKVEGPF